MAKKKDSEKQTPEERKAAFLKAAKASEKKWKEKRTIDPGSSFSQPEMEDGQYIARHHDMKVGTTQAGNPFVSWTWAVTEGENKGDKPNKFYGLEKDSGMEQLSKDLQRAGLDIAELALSEIPDIADELNEEKPVLKITVKNNEGKVLNPKTKKKETKNFLNVYVDSLIEDYEPDEDEEEEEEEEEEEKTSSKGGKGGKKPPKKGGKKSKDDDDEEDEEEEEDDEEEEEDEEEEDEDADPEKGDAVNYKPKGKKKASEFTVTKSDTKKKTVDLKNEDGDIHKGVSWDDVEIIFDDYEDEDEE